MAAAEIAEVAQKNEKLLAYRSSINQNLQFVVKPYLQFGTRDCMSETQGAMGGFCGRTINNNKSGNKSK